MKKRLLPLLLAITLLCTVLMLPIRADFGSFSGDSDYGGSYDYDDYDYSSGYDDYDYGGSSYYYYDDYDSDLQLSPAMIIFVLVILIVFAVIKSRIAKSSGSTHTSRPPVNAGASRTDDALLRPMDEYTSVDPSFDAADFREKLSNLYVQMQNQWTDRDLDPLRPYFTDALFAQMDRQVQQMKKLGRTNYIDRIAVLDVTLRGFRQADGEDHIIAEIQSRIVDYTMNDADKTILSGSDTVEKFMTYEWELTRTTGTATPGTGNAEDGEITQTVCPNCGAPVDINASARCEYCDTVLTQETHNWAICSIKGISQISG